jgi:hypothetical protein
MTTTPPREIDEMRAVANLPGLDIEIRHRRAPDEDAETVSITMRATPSFDAFAAALRGGPALPWLAAMTPFGMPGGIAGFDPFAPWIAMMQAWTSFLGGSMLPPPPSSSPPRLDGPAVAPAPRSTFDKPLRD